MILVKQSITFLVFWTRGARGTRGWLHSLWNILYSCESIIPLSDLLIMLIMMMKEPGEHPVSL